LSTGSTRRKSKIFLAFFLIFIFSYILINFVNAIIVGRLVVLPPYYARLSILIDGVECPETNSYCPGQTVYITNKLESLRNFNLTGNLSTSINNTINQEIHRETWDINLSVGEVVYKSTNYTIQETDEAGTYKIFSNFKFDGNSTNSTCKFRVKKGIGTLYRYPTWISDTLPPGGSKIYPAGIQLWLDEACNSTNAKLNKTTGITGDWISLSPDIVHLIPDFINSTDVNITVPPLTPEGVYDNGTIYAYADGQSVNVRLNITVSYFDFRLKVTVLNKKVCEGNDIDARINITKIFPPEAVRVNITYRIVDINDTVYDEGKYQDYLINDNETIILSTLRAPSLTGNYIFLVILERNLTLVQAYDTFEVISCPTLTTETGGGGGGGGPGEEVLPSKVYNLTLNVSDTILTVLLGNKTSFIATVSNKGIETVKSVRISIEGIPNEWISVFPSTKDIRPGEEEKYMVIINVPNTTETGVYKLNVKATDEVESNTEILTLIIGRNLKEIADLLLKELERVKAESEKALLIKKCLDVSVMNTFYDDSVYAMEQGKEEYKKGDYEKAIVWFEHTILTGEKVVQTANMIIDMELKTSNTSKILIPSFLKPEEQFRLAETYLVEKNYEKICDPINILRKFVLLGLIFWSIIILILIILLIISIIYYKKMRRRKKERMLKEAKKRIERIPPAEEQT
jgi:hypothetical protein